MIIPLWNARWIVSLPSFHYKCVWVLWDYVKIIYKLILITARTIVHGLQCSYCSYKCYSNDTKLRWNPREQDGSWWRNNSTWWSSSKANAAIKQYSLTGNSLWRMQENNSSKRIVNKQIPLWFTPDAVPSLQYLQG